MIEKRIKEKILVLDGAAGTMPLFKTAPVEKYLFENKKVPVIDIFNLTSPETVSRFHKSYVDAGADIIETNTFNCNAISLSDYGVSDLAYRLSLAGAEIAGKIASRYSEKGKEVFVAGSIGPSNGSLSISGHNANLNFDTVKEAYKPQIRGLSAGGVDFLLIETVFDTLMCKAVLAAAMEVFEETGREVPISISLSLTESGRNLSGQSIEAFYRSVKHVNPLSVGLNCGFGPDGMYRYLEIMAGIAECPVHAYPNAGLPNESGEYDLSSEEMQKHINRYIEKGLVNIVGGCCGTEPKHIALIAESTHGKEPRKIPQKVEDFSLTVAGLDAFHKEKANKFIKIGERTNTSGSKKFARLVESGSIEEICEIAREQIRAGADIIDICVDSMLDGKKEAMETILRNFNADIRIARVPFMIDSSDAEIIESALKLIQGKPIINSISLKDGERAFIKSAEFAKRNGAAVIVMLFDEKGQAVDFDRKIEIAQRATVILQKINFPKEDIIIDPNIIAIGTGIAEHDLYASANLQAIAEIKSRFPFVKISGGISNLSFAFRGNNLVRKCLHAVFVDKAKKAGLDMAIVNPKDSLDPEHYPDDLVVLAEDLILQRGNNPAIKLAEYRRNESSEIKTQNRAKKKSETLEEMIIGGSSRDIEIAVERELNRYKEPYKVIENPVLGAMNKVGKAFANGEMYLPQVLKSAEVMKKASQLLGEKMKNEAYREPMGRNKILLATVRGDVHDIGKNIVALVLSCSGYDIIDSGIMVEAECIVETATEEKPDIIGLSGLIAPSLQEMIETADALAEAGLNIPLILGGAAVSKAFIARNFLGKYSFPVVYAKDAAEAVAVTNELLGQNSSEFRQRTEDEYREINEKTKQSKTSPLIVGTTKDKTIGRVKEYGVSEPEYPEYDSFSHFCSPKALNRFFRIPASSKEYKKVFADSESLRQQLLSEKKLKYKYIFSFFKVLSSESGKVKIEVSGDEKIIDFSLPDGSPGLADYFFPIGNSISIGMFAVSTQLDSEYVKSLGNYRQMIANAVASVDTEAISEYLRRKISEDFFDDKIKLLNPAPGYALCPGEHLKRVIFETLDITRKIGIRLTETGFMIPESSICGFYCPINGDTE